MTQWDKPINYLQFLGIKAQLARELRLTPAEWMRVTATNLDSAGVFQNLVNTSGQVTEASASSINTNTQRVSEYLPLIKAHPTVGVITSGTTGAVKQSATELMGSTGAMTLAGGTLADHVLVPKVASYFGVIKLIALWSDTTFVATLDFEDEDNTDLSGIPTTMSFSLTADEVLWLHDITGWGAADNKDLEVDVTGGAGAEKLHLIYAYWYET